MARLLPCSQINGQSEMPPINGGDSRGDETKIVAAKKIVNFARFEWRLVLVRVTPVLRFQPCSQIEDRSGASFGTRHHLK